MSKIDEANSTTVAAKRFAFDPEMVNQDLSWLLAYPPFCKMDHQRFPKGAESVVQILQHESRVRHFSQGDVVIRNGEYANSAFLVLRGSVQLVLESLQFEESTASSPLQMNVWQRLVASMRGGKPGRSRTRLKRETQPAADESATLNNVGVRSGEDRPQIFLRDTDAILEGATSHPLGSGAIFGEMAAMTRSPNDYTAIARESCTILEVRWQGLRQLRRDIMFRKAIDDRYRETSLQTWLRSHPLLQFCSVDAIETIARKADLISYGEREWFVQYKQDRTAKVAEQIAAEPLICSEGEHAKNLYIVRSGFARKSYAYGSSHRTMAYLAQGQSFGFDEICHNATVNSIEEYLPYQYSLRALGYLDIISIDRETILEHVVPFCRKDALPPPILKPRLDRFASITTEGQYQPIDNPKAESLLEFIVENRLVNAKQAMIINTDRCTRCDDCIRACAAGHGGVSRFSRTGVAFGNFQFVESCMHCVDPVCMIGCPTGAIQRDNETGVVSINDPTCIGCKTCAESCPYQNIVMEMIDEAVPVLATSSATESSSGNVKMVASKCDLCQNLPGGPACVNACPHEALERVDLSDTERMREWLQSQSIRFV